MERNLMNSGNGYIHLLYGPMFAGKTSELIRWKNIYTVADEKCIIIKSEKDTRYSDKIEIVTHNNNKFEAICAKDDDLNLIDKDLLKDIKVILIDEAQFLKNLVEFCEYHANNGKIVILAGLLADYNRDHFPGSEIIDLFPKLDKLTALLAVCVRCKHNYAPFTHKFSSSSTSNEQITDKIFKYDLKNILTLTIGRSSDTKITDEGLGELTELIMLECRCVNNFTDKGILMLKKLSYLKISKYTKISQKLRSRLKRNIRFELI